MYFKDSVVNSALGHSALGLLWRGLPWRQGMSFPHPESAASISEHKMVGSVKVEEERLLLELLSKLWQWCQSVRQKVGREYRKHFLIDVFFYNVLVYSIKKQTSTWIFQKDIAVSWKPSGFSERENQNDVLHLWEINEISKDSRNFLLPVFTLAVQYKHVATPF